MEVDELIEGLVADDVTRRRAAAEALAGNAASAILPLVEACGDADEQVQESANAALEECGPPPLEVAPQLAALLPHPGPIGYWAATLLGRLQADAADWASGLAEAVGNNRDASVRQRAAWALGRIGPPASAAVPALEAASHDADARLARLSAEALEKINSPSTP